MALPVSPKRSYESAFQPTTPPTSPEVRPAKRLRFEEADLVEDVAAPLLTASSISPSTAPESQSLLTSRTLQVLSTPSASQTSPETTPPSSPAPVDFSRFEKMDTVQDIAALALTDSAQKTDPCSRKAHALPIMEKNPAQLPLMAHLLRRELGMGHKLQNSNYWFEKAQTTFKEEKNEEALKFISLAIDCCPKERVEARYLVFKGDIAYELGNYALAAEMWKSVAKQCPTFEAIGHLESALCMAKMGEWESSLRFLSQFIQTWNYWFITQPSECPLSRTQYLEHREIFWQAIDELKELIPSEDARAEYLVNLATLTLLQFLNSDVSSPMEIIHAYNPPVALNYLMIRVLKTGSQAEKKNLLTFLENHLETEQTIEGQRIDIPLAIPKLIFNQGLQNGQARYLQLAVNYFSLRLQPDERDERQLYLLNHLFFCNLALKKYDQASEIASLIENLEPRASRVPLALCSLVNGKPLTQNQIDDLNLALRERHPTIADPNILRFIHDRLLEGSGSGELNMLAARFEKFARIFIQEW